MNRFIGWGFAGGLILLTIPVHARSNAAIEAFNQGVQQFNAGHYADAIPYLDKAIDHDAEFAEAYYARAICKRSTQDSQGAVSDLNQAIQLKPDYIDAYSLRGAVWYEQEQWDPALQDFNTVLDHKPNDPQALLGRGVISLRQHHFETTRHDFRLFLKLRPDDPLAPKIRRALTAISAEGEPEEQASNPDRPAASRPPSPEAEKIARELFFSSHELSDSYQQKVIRGERAEAIGAGNPIDARSSKPASNDDVQIIDPK